MEGTDNGQRTTHSKKISQNANKQGRHAIDIDSSQLLVPLIVL